MGGGLSACSSGLAEHKSDTPMATALAVALRVYATNSHVSKPVREVWKMVAQPISSSTAARKNKNHPGDCASALWQAGAEL